MMIILDCEQLSEAWFQAKTGLPSASNFDMIIQADGKPSKQRQKYLYQLAGERASGCKVETYTNAAMQRGTELEGEARELFEHISKREIQQVGLVYADESKRYSCSPDGLMEDAGLEIKCPLIHTHVGYLLNRKLPTDYFQQVQGGMAVTGYKTWYYMSYYPGLQPLIIRVERDDKFIDKLKAELEIFCKELEIITDRLVNYSGGIEL